MMNAAFQPELPANAERVLQKALLFAYSLAIGRPARRLPAGLLAAWRGCLRNGTFHLGAPTPAGDVPIVVYGIGGLRYLMQAGDSLEGRQTAAKLIESALQRLLASLRTYQQRSDEQLLRELKAKGQNRSPEQLSRDPVVQEILRRHKKEESFAN